MFKKGQKVKVVGHEDFENVHRVGDLGVVESAEGDVVKVSFEGEKEPVEYPREVLEVHMLGNEVTCPGGKSGKVVRSLGGEGDEEEYLVKHEDGSTATYKASDLTSTSECETPGEKIRSGGRGRGLGRGRGKGPMGKPTSEAQLDEYFDWQRAKTAREFADEVAKEFRENYLEMAEDDPEMSDVVEYINLVWTPRVNDALDRIRRMGSAPVSISSNFPTLWQETSDAFTMAERGNMWGIDNVLGELVNALNNMDIPTSEAQQKQLDKKGKEGLPDSSEPKPAQMKKDYKNALKGKQKSLPQGQGGKERPSGKKPPEVDSDQLVIKGEQKQVKQVKQEKPKKKERPEKSAKSQSAGVTAKDLEIKGKNDQVKEAVFQPIDVRVLDEGDGEDEYVAIGGANAIRSERHLMSALRSAVRTALESMQRPFDAVDVVFRRSPVREQARRKVERELIATLHLLEDGRAKSTDLRKVAQRAVRQGIDTRRYVEYATDRYARHILTEAIKFVWPPSNIDGYVGQELIVETRTGDRLRGTLQRGPGKKKYHIKTASGATKTFGTNDVIRILKKTG